MSKWDKLIQAILKRDKGLRFEDLAKALIKMGYTQHQPKSGSSHYTFRKPNCNPITIPKHKPLNKAYIELVARLVEEYLEMEWYYE